MGIRQIEKLLLLTTPILQVWCYKGKSVQLKPAKAEMGEEVQRFFSFVYSVLIFNNSFHLLKCHYSHNNDGY